MNRREILKFTALATGFAVSAPLMSTLLTGCQAPEVDNDADYELQFFDKNQFHLVRDIVDCILPKSDSPSATDVGVHRMIDTMVGKVYSGEDKEKYKTNFLSLFKNLFGEGEKSQFRSLSEKEKIKQLVDLEISNDEASKDIRKAYRDLKQQTISYYLSTEEVATNFLTYLPVPGQYQPCITVAEAGGKAWAI